MLKRKVKTFSKIVLFSDLHVCPKTLDTCLEVLDEVHSIALERRAAVAFLGDFWDVRGVLPVACVNAILDSFKKWRVPCFMIPGNHDQVTIGGDVHALHTLEMADNTVQVFTKPTVFADGLWVPYRRNKSEVLEAIDCYEGEYMALFLHIDTIGAWMNGSFKADIGISTSELPEGIPVYTGHYHKPHTVDGKVVYVGSQYEVSRSEAGDKKRVLVIDRSTGYSMDSAEEVRIDVGPKHLDGRFEGEGFVTYSGGEVFEARAGDRVRVHTKDPKKTKEVLATLASGGIASEVVVETKKAESRINVTPDMSPISLLKGFMKDQETDEATASVALDLIKSVVGGRV